MPSSSASTASSASSAAAPMVIEGENDATSANDGWSYALQDRLNAFRQGQTADNSTLNLSFLGLSSLSADIFNGIGHITRLELAGNRLQTLPNEIANLTCLTHLDLGMNAIGDLPDSMARLSKLKFLSLFRQQLADDPRASPLVEVPRCIASLSQLETLVLSDNALSRLDPGLGDLSELRELMASNNKIVDLPMSFSGLHNLTSLSLIHNKLTNFPAVLEKLLSLTEIYLAGNDISSLKGLSGPENLEKSTNHWKILDLEANRINTLDHVWKIAPGCQIFLYGNTITQTSLGKRPANREADRSQALKAQHPGIEVDSYENVMTQNQMNDA